MNDGSEWRPAAQSLAEIEESLLVAVDALGLAWSPDLRIRDRDVAALLGMSMRQAEALREEGEAWPRITLPLAGARYSVRISQLAEWLQNRPSTV